MNKKIFAAAAAVAVTAGGAAAIIANASSAKAEEATENTAFPRETSPLEQRKAAPSPLTGNMSHSPAPPRSQKYM